MLREIAEHCTFLQNIAVNIISALHPTITHNIAKIEMLKAAFLHCEQECIEGNYYEFGVYEGSSLYAALTLNQKITSKIKRNFYGFDSFDAGFKYFDERDRHPFWKEGTFKSSYSKTVKRVKRFSNVNLIRGYFEETIAGKDVRQICGNGLGAIIFIDCDFMNPALIALNFIKPILQRGSVIILDDYWAYKGSTELGEYGAFNQFLQVNKNIGVRQWRQYGVYGNSFMVTKV